MEPIQINRLVQIKQTQSEVYLSSTPFHVTIFGRAHIDNTDITLTKDDIEEHTFFVLECDKQNSSLINYGDLVYVRNFKTQLYLNTEKFTEKKQCFVIQPISGQSCHQYFNRIVDEFRLFCPENMKYLTVSNNNKWEFTSGHYQKVILPPINSPIYVHHKDTVIIRNWWTGMTLHSHEDFSKSCNEQEITCFPYPRDGILVLILDNDKWLVLKPNQQSSLITNYPLYLQHKMTGLYLSGKKKETFSKQGFQAFCSHEQKIQFSIIEFDPLPLEKYKPFVIIVSNMYLTQLKHGNENGFGQQQECGLAEKPTAMSFWMIE